MTVLLLSPPPVPAMPRAELSKAVVMPVPAGRMAEPTAAIDPADPRHIAVAADPYLDPTRILATVSRDGGRTWERPITVRPPGFTKSYDPDLAFDRSGNLLISGGASRAGRRYCQPGSVVFLARLSGRRTHYELITRPDGGYVDRPALINDRAGGFTALSWTRSTGKGAECRAVARRSTTWLAWRRGQNGGFIKHRLPLGQPAAYGAELAADRPGRVLVAVAGWHRDQRQAISVTAVDLTGGSVRRLGVLPAGRRPPLSLGTGLPLNLSAASLSAGGTRFAVAWTQARGRRILSRVALAEAGGGWQLLDGPPAAGTPMLPTIALDPSGSPTMVQADLTRGGLLRFAMWRRTPRAWVATADLGSTSGKNYPELGELLGLSAVRGTVVAAVPAGARPSALAVSVWTPHAVPPHGTARKGADAGPHQRRERATMLSRAAVALVLGVLTGLTLVSLRRRGGTDG